MGRVKEKERTGDMRGEEDMELNPRNNLFIPDIAQVNL